MGFQDRRSSIQIVYLEYRENAFYDTSCYGTTHYAIDPSHDSSHQEALVCRVIMCSPTLDKLISAHDHIVVQRLSKLC